MKLSLPSIAVLDASLQRSLKLYEVDRLSAIWVP
jgi:hypothetical protein